MRITEACIQKPVFAWMLMAGTVLFGIVAASRIGISQMPDVDFPTINVSVNWEGAAPEVVENDVLQPLEEALVQVEGVAGLTSTARQGSGSVTVELDLSRDVDLALQDVTAKVQQAARRLPRDEVKVGAIVLLQMPEQRIDLGHFASTPRRGGHLGPPSPNALTRRR